MLILTKEIHVTGNIVVLDSGYFFWQVLVDTKNKGLYGATLVNNRWYWPRYINGGNIKACFANKGYGAVDALIGDNYNVNLCVFAMK